MILKDWLEKNNLKAYEISKGIGISQGTLYRNLKSGKKFRPETCEKIENFTKGEVDRVEAMWPELSK